MYSGYRHAHAFSDCYASRCGPLYVPVYYVPAAAECCDTFKVPHELNVPASSTAPADALVGGTSDDISLSVEYLVEPDAGSPSVTLTTTSGTSTSTWSDSTPTTGYHVQEGVLSVKAGTKITLAVSNVTARVRWCEIVSC
jgi:hypothetical protein